MSIPTSCHTFKKLSPISRPTCHSCLSISCVLDRLKGYVLQISPFGIEMFGCDLKQAK